MKREKQEKSAGSGMRLSSAANWTLRIVGGAIFLVCGQKAGGRSGIYIILPFSWSAGAGNL